MSKKLFLFLGIFFVVILLYIPLSSAAGTKYFPPNANWMQGLSTGVGSVTNDSNYLAFSIQGVGASRYWVSNTLVDITNFSYIEIDWSGTWGISTIGGNISFGISTSQLDNSFITSITRTATFSRRVENLSVSNYYGNYYLKFGGNITTSPIVLPITGYLYGVTGHNYSFCAPLSVDTITETTALLRGYVIDSANASCTVGFWYGNETTSQTLVTAGVVQNVTVGTYTEGQSFTYLAESLTSGRYYYVRPWIYNGYSFNVSNGYAVNLSSGWTYPGMTFPPDIWLGNRSIGMLSTGDSCENFTKAGGVYNDVDYIFRHNGGWDSWLRDDPPVWWSFENIESYVDQPTYSYYFHSTNTSTIYLRFKYDNGTSQEGYFLTLPTAPLTFSASAYSSTSLYVTWTNATLPAGRNQSVYIRYKTGTPPTNMSDGTFGANVSSVNWAIITGLPQETTVYFSAWTYINASGSPLLHCFSDEYISTYNTTVGGTYNVIVRYENESTAGNLPVNLSKYGPHNFIIHYTDETDYVIFFNGNHTSDVVGYFINNASGNFTVDTTKAVSYFEFNWNDSVGMDARCNRIIIPTTGEYNITFYIRTNLPIYGETSALMNQTLVRYTYGFIDTTGKFRYPNNPRAIIYKYNSTGTYMLIHSAYFDAAGNINPWLVYGEKYFIGVSCDLLTITRISVAPTADELNPQITIPYEWQIRYTFFDLININIGWLPNGFYVNYVDTTSSTLSATIRIYYYSNNTEVYNSTTNLNNKNWTITCNTSFSYLWEINTTIEDSEELYTGEYRSTKIPMIAGSPTITDITTLDNLFTIIFGPTPFVSADDASVYVSWTYVLIFVICFILMATFGRLNALVGALSVGLTLIFAGVAISGVGITLIIVGFFVVAISIVGLLGGVEKG